MVFPSRRKDVAVQAVKIKNQDPQNPTQKKQVTYTFCLERILEGSHQVRLLNLTFRMFITLFRIAG